MPRYDHRTIEPKRQSRWEIEKTFRTPDVSAKQKLYYLDMFPYPSGDGLHVGHPEGYTATDILTRYKRMCGYNVLHTMGWDAFGLPAEEHARQTGEHPRIQTKKNIGVFRRQIKMLGFSYDWDREIDTTDPLYFRWTQWIFLQIHDTWFDSEQRKGRPISELPIPPEVAAQGDRAIRAFQDSKRLAYQAEAQVNWCPALGTVLANEEVVDGKSERGAHPVVRMPMRQWILRITAYAERLLDDLSMLDWPEPIKAMQRNWVGRSEGAMLEFALVGGDQTICVFTTRPDTLFGATYMVLAPEHPLVDQITTTDQLIHVKKYQEKAARKSDMERTDLAKEKTGVFTGAFAINPVNGEHIPVLVADYVLSGYGTGAIMAVPAHDTRDWEFARALALPIRQVVQPPTGYQPSRDEAALAYDEGGTSFYPFLGEGAAINSGPFNGLPTAELKNRITIWLQEQGVGKGAIIYKLRDWLFSRQRLWGEPVPLLHEVDADGKATGAIEPLSEAELPLELPEIEDYRPSGRPEPPLEKAVDWLYVERNGKRYKRETNTMPQWAGSCWYYLRYLDPKNDKAFCDPEKEKNWMPVDLYVGGAEHAVLHLLYARFWHKVLYDRGHVHMPEPFKRLVNQGMILGETELTGYTDAVGKWVSATYVKPGGDQSVDNRTGEPVCPVKLAHDQVTKKAGGFVLTEDPSIAIDSRAFKMSKSRGNVVNPDDIVRENGADALRLYEMFMGPLESEKPWSTSGLQGICRFLGKAWRLVVDERSTFVRLNPAVQDIEPTPEQLRVLHKTIRDVTQRIDKLSFNTAISSLMEYVNGLGQVSPLPKDIIAPFVLLLSPFAPHIAEELWEILGHADTLAYEPWPKFDPSLVLDEEIEIPVMVNDKVRSRIKIALGASDETVRTIALADARIAQFTCGKSIASIRIVQDRMVALVVR